MLDFLLQLDRDIFLFLNGLNHPVLDPVMFYISDRFVWIPFYFFLLYLIIKNYGWKAPVILMLTVLLITLSDQISDYMKDNIHRYRPSRDESLGDLVHIVRGHRGGMYGFVSSHAANTFALATFMIHMLIKQAKYMPAVLLAYAGLKSYSRIYLGVHYPGDVIGGAILGFLIGLFVIAIWKLIQKKYYPENQSLA